MTPLMLVLASWTVGIGAPPPDTAYDAFDGVDTEPDDGYDRSFHMVCAHGFDACKTSRVPPFRDMFLSPDDCLRSQDCFMRGACGFDKPASFCVKPTGPKELDCGPDSAPCRLYGRCKVGVSYLYGKPEWQCAPTREGCANSWICKHDGSCRLIPPGAEGGGIPPFGVCAASKAGCAASWACQYGGDCTWVKGQRGSDGRYCASTEAGTRASMACVERGACILGGFAGPEEGCAASANCARYGLCAPTVVRCTYTDRAGCMSTPCGPTRPEHCRNSEGCRRFGACTASLPGDGCVVSTETDSCEVERVRVAAIRTSATHAPVLGTTFHARHLIDRDPDTAWLPATTPTPDEPARITVQLTKPERVVGVAFVPQILVRDPYFGPLTDRFPDARGMTIRAGAGETPLAHQLIELGVNEQTWRFAPTITDTVVFELVDAYPHPENRPPPMTEVAVLRCKAEASSGEGPSSNEGGSR